MPLIDILQRVTIIQHLSHMSFLLRCEVQIFLTSLFSIFVYLILFEKRGFQISMSRDFSEKIRNFSLGKTGLFQKIGNFAFSTNRTFPKNWEFHQNSLHIRFPILSKPVYIKKYDSLYYLEVSESKFDIHIFSPTATTSNRLPSLLFILWIRYQ